MASVSIAACVWSQRANLQDGLTNAICPVGTVLPRNYGVWSIALGSRFLPDLGFPDPLHDQNTSEPFGTVYVIGPAGFFGAGFWPPTGLICDGVLGSVERTASTCFTARPSGVAQSCL